MDFSSLRHNSIKTIHKNFIQLKAEVFNPPDVFPLIPMVNKSSDIVLSAVLTICFKSVKI